MSTIVVGVDGSPGADRAVSFAAHEAGLRGVPLRMVTAWHVPTAAYGIGVAAVGGVGAEFEADASRCLEDTTRRLEAELAALEIELVVREGPAARVLVEESGDAALLVVGSRGRGGFVGLLMGSVSGQCAHHARCPVAIVPSES